MAGGLPPLQISSGPALSEANSNLGGIGSGDFSFKPKGGLIQQTLPLVALVAVAWLVTRQ
ncbi:hypothetical protein G5B38_02355 [Pseudohalocynthiibacter aestuariivivens]|nr:hypothetical protein G5B38_02355 [Pseudohalocynthiibacter aestuariivivens]